jgi:hypothetical protein
VLSTLKQASDSEGLILRVFNSSDEETRAALRFGVPVDAPYRTNPYEEILEELTPQGYRVELHLKGVGIETVFVKLHWPERWVERLETASQGKYRRGKGGAHDEEDGKPPRLLEA